MNVVNNLDVTFIFIDLIENQMTKHITFTSSQITHYYNQSSSKVHRKALTTINIIKDIFYETTPYYEQCLARCGYNEKLTYQQQGKNTENNENIGKIKNAILYGLTHPTANRWRQTLANTFLNSSKNILHQVTNFTKSLIKTL